MNGIQKAAKIFTKIMEVGHWVAVGLMSAAGILAAVAPQWLKYVMDVESLAQETEVSAYGFAVNATDGAGHINYTTVVLFALGATVVFALMALAFRNLHLIIKRSEHATPFSDENINSLKWISRFSILVPLVGLVMSAVIHLVVGENAAEISLDQSGIVMGIIVLCLTQYFIHGAQLEKEVDGLV